MICYVFKIRQAKYTSKRDNKSKNGWNVGLVALEGSKFHLETFIDSKDNPFAKVDLEKVFTPGFYDIDIDEFEVYTPQGSQYQKKIIKIRDKKSLDDARQFL